MNNAKTTVQRWLARGWKPAALAIAVLGLAVATSTVQAGRNVNPGVLPPQSHAYGMSCGNWGAEWWKWVYSFPADQNPVTDPTGEIGTLSQSGPVWFLAGTFGQTVQRTITIPAGKAIFFPLYNIWNDYPCPDPGFQPAPGQSLYDFLRIGAAGYIDPNVIMAAEVDGVPLLNLSAYRAVSGPDVTVFTGDPSWASMNMDPCVTGTPQVAVADGYWIMLAPLKPGQHTIHFSAEAWAGTFNLDVTYYITVQ